MRFGSNFGATGKRFWNSADDITVDAQLLRFVLIVETSESRTNIKFKPDSKANSGSLAARRKNKLLMD